MAEPPKEMCPRPYRLGRRLESTNRNRQRVLDAARELLTAGGVSEFSFEAISRRAGVTRQTIHNQFGTKRDLLEALCDEHARKSGMEEMATAFQQSDPLEALARIIAVFCHFWSADPLMTRRIQGLGNVDPEFKDVLKGRNQRRRFVAQNILNRIAKQYGKPLPEELPEAINVFYALTSFEYYDLLAREIQPPEHIVPILNRLMLGYLGIPK
jgi:AcrR family transcriptional regulator